MRKEDIVQTSFEYDEIFGMDLGRYCELHGISVMDLIKKVETDIDILQGRFRELFTNAMAMSPLEKEVYKLIAKKQKHRDRLYEWMHQSQEKALEEH